MEARPRKFRKVRHFHEPGDLHELTFSCYRRESLLVDHANCELLAKAIERGLTEHALHLGAFVFMPKHVHLLIWPANPLVCPTSEFLKTMKLSASTRMKRRWARLESDRIAKQQVRERPGKECFRFWQEGSGYDRNLRTRRAALASIDYIHTNPVKRKLCQRATDWYWSSARHFEGLPGPQPRSRPCRQTISCAELDAASDFGWHWPAQPGRNVCSGEGGSGPGERRGDAAGPRRSRPVLEWGEASPSKARGRVGSGCDGSVKMGRPTALADCADGLVVRRAD